MQVVPECQNARLIALYIDNTGKIRRRVPIRQQGGKPFGHAVLFQFFILPDSGCFFLHFKRKESPRSQAEAPLAKKLLQQKPGKMFRGLYDYVQTRSPAPTAAQPEAVSCSLRSRRSLRRTRSRPASAHQGGRPHRGCRPRALRGSHHRHPRRGTRVRGDLACPEGAGLPDLQRSRRLRGAGALRRCGEVPGYREKGAINYRRAGHTIPPFPCRKFTSGSSDF